MGGPDGSQSDQSRARCRALVEHPRGKAGQLAAEAGGKACATPAEVAQHAECVFLCVGDSAMSEAVILGPGRREGRRAERDSLSSMPAQ